MPFLIKLLITININFHHSRMIRQCVFVCKIYNICHYNIIIIVINYQLSEIPLRLNSFSVLVHVLFAIGCTTMACYFP